MLKCTTSLMLLGTGRMRFRILTIKRSITNFWSHHCRRQIRELDGKTYVQLTKVEMVVGYWPVRTNREQFQSYCVLLCWFRLVPYQFKDSINACPIAFSAATCLQSTYIRKPSTTAVWLFNLLERLCPNLASSLKLNTFGMSNMSLSGSILIKQGETLFLCCKGDPRYRSRGGFS